MDYVLTTDGLCKKYKGFKALDNLSIHIPKGSIYGLVGKNGAGKTTLIRILCGLQAPTYGTYTLFGTVNTDKAAASARQRIGAVVETPSLFSDMSARDNIIQQYRLIGKPDDSEADNLLRLVGLENTGNKKVRNFSLGMKQRLGIAIALSGNCDFIILDEPVNGLDPQGIIDIRELLLKLNRELGITVLISSHILDELSRLATHYGFLENGHLLKEISAEQLENICRKYLYVKGEKIHLLMEYLDDKRIDYYTLGENELQVFGKPDINDIVLSLNNKGFRFVSISEHEESLESYFINLAGGRSDD